MAVTTAPRESWDPEGSDSPRIPGASTSLARASTTPSLLTGGDGSRRPGGAPGGAWGAAGSRSAGRQPEARGRPGPAPAPTPQPGPRAAPAAHLPRGQGVRGARRAHRGEGRAACPRRTPAAAQVLPPEPRAGRCAAEPQTRRPGRGAPGAGKAAGPGRASVCLSVQWGRGRRPSAADWRRLGLGGGRPRDAPPPSALRRERSWRPRFAGPMPSVLAAQPPGAGARSFLTQPHVSVARKFS